MNIRSKITLIFTLLTGSLLTVAFVVIYIFSDRYTKNEFYQRLNERASIIGEAHFEEDEVSAQVYEEILKRYQQILPSEKELIFRVDTLNKEITENIEIHFPDEFIINIFEKRKASIANEGTYSLGILYIDNEGDFIVIVSAKNHYGELKMKNLLNILVAAFVLFTILTFLLGKIYAARVLIPVSKINKQADDISATNLHLRLDEGNGKDELSNLAKTFNKMLERLETTFFLQNNFINNASHEFKNPLAVIRGESEIVLRKERNPEEYKIALKSIAAEAKRLDGLVNGLLKLAQADISKKETLIESIRIDELLLEAKTTIDTINPQNNIVFSFSELPSNPDALIVHGNRNLLRNAFVNIIDNACKFSGNKQVTIRISSKEDIVKVAVADKGVGIPPDELDNLMEPLFRASNVRNTKGFGVGFSFAYRIIKVHKGKIKVDSKMNENTTISIELPTA